MAVQPGVTSKPSHLEIIQAMMPQHRSRLTHGTRQRVGKWEQTEDSYGELTSMGEKNGFQG